MIVPLGLCGSVWRESLLLALRIWRPFAAAKRCRHAAVMNSDRWKVGREESTQRGRPARQRSVPVKQRKRSHYGEKAAPLNRLTASQARGPSLEEFQLTEIRTSSRPIPVHSAGAIGGLVPSDVNMRARGLMQFSSRVRQGAPVLAS